MAVRLIVSSDIAGRNEMTPTHIAPLTIAAFTRPSLVLGMSESITPPSISGMPRNAGYDKMLATTTEPRQYMAKRSRQAAAPPQKSLSIIDRLQPTHS